MPDTVGRRGKNIGDPGIDFVIVALILLKRVGTEQERQELFVRDDLDLCLDDCLGFLIEAFVIVFGMGFGDLVDETVVLAHEDRMERQEGTFSPARTSPAMGPVEPFGPALGNEPSLSGRKSPSLPSTCRHRRGGRRRVLGPSHKP